MALPYTFFPCPPPLSFSLSPVSFPSWPPPQPEPESDGPGQSSHLPSQFFPPTAKTYTVARETVQTGHQGLSLCAIFPLQLTDLHSLGPAPTQTTVPPSSVLAFHTEVLFSKILIQIQVTRQGLSHFRFPWHSSGAGIHLIFQVQLRVTVMVPTSNLCSAQALMAVSTIPSFALCSTFKN